MSIVSRRHLAGLEPEKLSGTVLRLHRGSIANAGATACYNSNDLIDIDMGTVGANGLDTGSPVHGADYFPYVIRNTATGALGAVLSQSIAYGNVVLPAGYEMVRKLPWGFVYRTNAGYGQTAGIPDFHLAHWPKPQTVFTAQQMAAPFTVLSSGAAADWTTISLAGLIPDNARMSILTGRVTFATRAGTAFVRTYDTQSAGVPVGAAYAPGHSSYSHDLHLRVKSDRTMQYKVTGGVNLTLAVKGFCNTEPS